MTSLTHSNYFDATAFLLNTFEINRTYTQSSVMYDFHGDMNPGSFRPTYCCRTKHMKTVHCFISLVSDQRALGHDLLNFSKQASKN
jgi:hypothetical protein